VVLTIRRNTVLPDFMVGLCIRGAADGALSYQVFWCGPFSFGESPFNLDLWQGVALLGFMA